MGKATRSYWGDFTTRENIGLLLASRKRKSYKLWKKGDPKPIRELIEADKEVEGATIAKKPTNGQVEKRKATGGGEVKKTAGPAGFNQFSRSL